MALIQMGSMVTDARGSVGGVVYSRNNGGNYSRRRVAGVNPATPAQSLVRASFGELSKLWSGTLSQSQRDQWTFFAQANPVVNRLGASIILSGMAFMQKLNRILSQAGEDPILVPPSDLSVPDLPSVTGAAFTLTGPSATITTDVQSVVAGAAYYIEATGSLAPGQKPPSTAYRFMGVFPAVAAATDVDFTSPWSVTFGHPTVRANVGVRTSTVNTASGAKTPGIVFYAPVQT